MAGAVFNSGPHFAIGCQVPDREIGILAGLTNQADLARAAYLRTLACLPTRRTGLYIFEIVQYTWSFEQRRVVVIVKTSVNQLADRNLSIHVHDACEPIVSFWRRRILRSEVAQTIGMNVCKEKVIQIAAFRGSHLPQDIT